MPTQLFVLTDGEVYNIDECKAVVKQAVDQVKQSNQTNNQSNFVRLFSIGVGNGVSTDLVEGLSSVGGGYTQYVVEGERMEKKVGWFGMFAIVNV